MAKKAVKTLRVVAWILGTIAILIALYGIIRALS